MPSWEKIGKYRKADILIIANFYGDKVSYSGRKAEVKATFCAELMDKSILPSLKAAVEPPDGGTVKVDPETEPGLDAKLPEVVNMLPAEVESEVAQAEGSIKDLRLTLHIREVEAHTEALEVQAMHLRVRVLKLERKPAVASTPVSGLPTMSTIVLTVLHH